MPPQAIRLTVAVMVGQKAKDHLDRMQAEQTMLMGRGVTQSECVEALQMFWDAHPELRQP